MTRGQTTTHLTLKCIEPDRCSVVFEPYGHEIVLLADDEIQLRIVSPDGPRIELAYSPGCLTVWLPEAMHSISAQNRLGEALDLGILL